MLEDGLQEGAPLVAGGLLVKHASLDHLLVNIELVLGRGQNLLLYAVDRAETEHPYLVLLPDAVGAVLGLQVLEEEMQVSPDPALWRSKRQSTLQCRRERPSYSCVTAASCRALLPAPTSSF